MKRLLFFVGLAALGALPITTVHALPLSPSPGGWSTQKKFEPIKPLAVALPEAKTAIEPVAPPKPAIPPPAPKLAPVVASNEAMALIFSHESGNNPLAVNPGSGACGLGQALPCSKLTAVCSMTDVVCQTAFFENYAISRYGSWAAAWVYWQVHKWW